jgi:hypothetical protein
MQVMLLLASAPRSPFLLNDLGSSGKLQFRAHARELGAQAVQLLDVDHAPLVHLPARQPHASTAGATAAGPLSNGHQTMVIAAVYTVSAGHCRLHRCMLNCAATSQCAGTSRLAWHGSPVPNCVMTLAVAVC